MLFNDAKRGVLSVLPGSVFLISYLVAGWICIVRMYYWSIEEISRKCIDDR